MAKNKGSSGSKPPEFGETLSRVLNEINDEAKNRKCAFRGQANAAWPLTSGAARRIRKGVEDTDKTTKDKLDESLREIKVAVETVAKASGVQLNNSVNEIKKAVQNIEDATKGMQKAPPLKIPPDMLISYHDILLDKARRKGFGLFEGRKLDELELMAQVQHLEAATMLLDFTLSPQVALYFACKDKSKWDQDGKVFIIPISEHEVAPDDIGYKEMIQNEKIYQWSPILFGPAERRMLVQASLFLINLPEEEDGKTIFAVDIPKDDKPRILEELDQLHKVSGDMVFSDLAGFAKNQSDDRPLDDLEKGLKETYLVNIKIGLANDRVLHLTHTNADKDKYAEAIELYSEVLEKNPDLAEAYHNRGVCKAQIGDLEDAIEDHDEAIRLKPNFAESYHNRGVCKVRLDRSEEALTDFDKAIHLKPDLAQAHFARGVIKEKSDDDVGAIEDYSEAIRAYPDFAEAYFSRGVLKKNAGDYVGAMADYSEAIRVKPDFADAYCNRGVIKGESGNNIGALADFDKAIRLNPSLAEAYSGRGSAKKNTRDYIGALADFAEAIRVNPNLAEVYYNRGACRAEDGDYIGALADVDEAIRLKPDLAEAYKIRGDCNERLDRLEEALADFSEAIRLRPNFVGAYYNRGVVKGKSGDDVGAIKDFDEAIRLNSDFAEAYSDRGAAKANSGNYVGALADFDEAIRLNPDIVRVYFNRGNCEIMLGNFEEAIEDFIKVFELDNTFLQFNSLEGFSPDEMLGITKALDNARQQAIKFNNNERQAVIQAIIKKLHPPQPKE